MMYKSLFILGRQPAIGLAELESVLGSTHVLPLGSRAALSDIAVDAIPFSRLGGSVRLATIIGEMDAVQWPAASRTLYKVFPSLLAGIPAEGKLKLGLSIFGLPIDSKQLFRTGLELKKICKQAGRSVRLVPNNEPELNSASVLHNQLTGDLGVELLLVRGNNTTYVARTTAVQDIDAYAARDQGRPKRDARVGMLPPKLAQTIINLSGAKALETLLDPFCGTGVILQEALLMGIDAYGSDLEPRMIDYTRENLEWLVSKYDVSVGGSLSMWYSLQVGDATTAVFASKHTAPIQHIACETYLGRPLSGWPAPQKLHEIIGTCNAIIEKFMLNAAAQFPAGSRFCVAVPAWNSPQGQTYHLPLLDRLNDLGYNRVSFEHAEAKELLYSRPDQIVARELLVITRK